MAYENLLTESVDAVRVITLNRPKANALSQPLMVELIDALEAAKADDAVRAVVITGGEGRFFAAGADIPTLQAQINDPLADGGFLATGLQAMAMLEAFPKPVVAAINGMALGGGCELSLACHVRIAAETAQFGQPEINLGIIPGWGGTHRLVKVIGFGRAYEWLLTGRTFSAEEALQAGLVCKVVPAADLRTTALELAQRAGSKAPVAMQQTLSVLADLVRRPADGAALEAEAFKAVAASRDATEGITAFLEKREARFTGK